MVTPTTPRVDVEALRRDYPLVDLVAASGVELTPAGPQRHKGCCPFHADRQPSFVVYTDDQHFHCFGCGAHGDVVDFVRRRFGLGFAEACAWLQTLTPQPPSVEPPKAPPPPRWDRLTLTEQVVMNTAVALYHQALWRAPHALAYLRARAISDVALRRCAVGYVVGRRLLDALPDEASRAAACRLGLLREDPVTGRLHERLAGRIVVPELRDGQGVWFIGRRLEDGRGPKYLALPGERPVLGQARVASRRRVYLCEGVFDYLTAVGWRLPAFSPCGLSLPPERLGFLARAQIVYGVLDADSAGREASERWARLLGRRWRPVILPDGLDLNDLAQRPDGRGEFFRRVAAARDRAVKEVGRAACAPG